jgi:hypothetical protein
MDVLVSAAFRFIGTWARYRLALEILASEAGVDSRAIARRALS